jgi:hypothetical protein
LVARPRASQKAPYCLPCRQALVPGAQRGQVRGRGICCWCHACSANGDCESGAVTNLPQYGVRYHVVNRKIISKSEGLYRVWARRRQNPCSLRPFRFCGIRRSQRHARDGNQRGGAVRSKVARLLKQTRNTAVEISVLISMAPFCAQSGSAKKWVAPRWLWVHDEWMPSDSDIAELELIVARIVRESGRREGFDAKCWIDRWLADPLPAMGGRRPVDVLEDPGGLERVRAVLLRMQSGAYS